LYDFHARQYDPATIRFTGVDPLAEKSYSWTPFRYGFNNPMRFNDPTGMTEEERLAAVNKMKTFIGKKYEEMDCSEAADKAVRESTDLGTLKTGEGIPKKNGDGHWDNGVALMVSNSRNVESKDDMKVGNTATFRSGRSSHKGENGEYDHIGMISDVTKNDDGKVASFKVIHSSTNSGVVEKKYDFSKGKEGMPGYEFRGVQAWDTPTANAGTIDAVVKTNEKQAKIISKMIDKVKSKK
jgi:uncharacterized protein RhaS with RHS repeats